MRGSGGSRTYGKWPCQGSRVFKTRFVLEGTCLNLHVEQGRSLSCWIFNLRLSLVAWRAGSIGRPNIRTCKQLPIQIYDKTTGMSDQQDFQRTPKWNIILFGVEAAPRRLHLPGPWCKAACRVLCRGLPDFSTALKQARSSKSRSSFQPSYLH